MTLVLRPPLYQRLSAALAFAGAGAVFMSAGLLEGDQVRWVVTVVGVLSLLMASRAWGLRVEAWPDHLALVNWVSTVRVAREDVVEVRWDEGLVVRRLSGREISASAFPGGPAALDVTGHPGRAAAEQLERWRRRSA